MIISLNHIGQDYTCDLSKGSRISIPLNKKGPKAYGAKPFSSLPIMAEGFIGDLRFGSPVNYYDISINPHGNGTHTESMLHVDASGLSVFETLQDFHLIGLIMSVEPLENAIGDELIKEEQIDWQSIEETKPNALIIRTLPNEENKLTKNYTGTNPPYLEKKMIERLNKSTVRHLLIDLPSVDKEIDGGKLEAHKTFWNDSNGDERSKTITEMVYVENQILDGLYLLNLQVLPLQIDASPSNPIVYKLLPR